MMYFLRGSVVFTVVVPLFFLLSDSPSAVVEGTPVPLSIVDLGGEIANLTIGAFNEQNFRQSFCDRYDLIHNDAYAKSMNTSVTIRNVLSGTHINALMNTDSDYFNYNGETGINKNVPGIHADILDYIAKESNFTWRNSFGLYYWDEVTENKTFTDILAWGVDTYDIVIDYWAPSMERMSLEISFCSPYFDGSMIMIDKVEPKAQQKILWLNWLRPFELPVWGTIIFTILFSAIVYPIIERKENEERSFRKWFTGRLYLSCINFTGNYSYEPTTLAGCTFGFVFAFWSMLMLAAYTANLASLLVVKRSGGVEIINTIDDAIHFGKTMCVPEFTYAHEFITKNYPQYESYFVLVPGSEKYNALNNGECDILIGYAQEFDNVKLKKAFNPDCKLQQEGRTVDNNGFAFATKLDPGYKCSLLVNEVINYYLKEMQESGYLTKLWDSHATNFADKGHCKDIIPCHDFGSDGSCGEIYSDDSAVDGTNGAAASASAASTGNDDTGEQLSLKLEDMAGTFLFQVVGSIVAIIVTIISYHEKKYHYERKNRRESKKKLEQNKGISEQTITFIRDSEESNGEQDSAYNDVIKSRRTQTFHYKAETDYVTKSELLDIHDQLDYLQASHNEMKQQMDTIITALESICNSQNQ